MGEVPATISRWFAPDTGLASSRGHRSPLPFAAISTAFTAISLASLNGNPGFEAQRGVLHGTTPQPWRNWRR